MAKPASIWQWEVYPCSLPYFHAVATSRSPTWGHQEGFGSCQPPLTSLLPPTMGLLQPQGLGNICGKKRDEGRFYQSHHEEELILCLNNAKVVQGIAPARTGNINWFANWLDASHQYWTNSCRLQAQKLCMKLGEF